MLDFQLKSQELTPIRSKMGIGLRIFLVNDDDTIKRLALRRFNLLLKHNPDECLPQYAGKRVRYALVILEIGNRKPIEILRIQYSFLLFDSDGRLEPSEQEKWKRLALDMLPPIFLDKHSQQVIDARHKFVKKRYDNEYRWTPSPEIEAAIVRSIFKTK